MEAQVLRELRFHALAKALAEAGDLGTVGDAGNADAVVGGGRDGPCDGCAMLLAARFRAAIVIAVDSVVIKSRVDLAEQVGVAVLDAAIDDADDDTQAGIVVPHLGDVDVEAGLARIVQVPLLTEPRIRGDRGRAQGRNVELARGEISVGGARGGSSVDLGLV